VNISPSKVMVLPNQPVLGPNVAISIVTPSTPLLPLRGDADTMADPLSAARQPKAAQPLFSLQQS